MEESFKGIEKFTKIKIVCARIYQNQKDIDSVKELRKLIGETSPTLVKSLESIICSVFFPILKSLSESSTSYKEKEKQEIIDTFKILFEKIPVDKLQLFLNIYGFLLFEIYDYKNHRVQIGISEEYKLSIVQCVTSLARSLDNSVVEVLYVKENAPKLSQMIFAVLEMAKHEQLKLLRVSAIHCIMALARVLDDNDFGDLITRNQIADVFLFFLPGVASQLKHIALIDEKFGHKVPAAALEAWGRLVTLLMQDYNATDQKITLSNDETETEQFTDLNKIKKLRWDDEKELNEYILKTGRSPDWYKQTDKKLQQIIIEFSKLTHHSHAKVRLELVNTAQLLIENCFQTMPSSLSHLIDIVIILSEDADESVSAKSTKILESLSGQLTKTEFKNLLDNIEEGFYGVVTSIPRKFNGIDDKVQIAALNSLIGYIKLFGKYSLQRVLYSSVHLNRLILTLIHISEFDKSNISLLEEYTLPDYELHQDLRRSWRQFRRFKEDTIVEKITLICRLLGKFGVSTLVSDFLLDVIVSDSDQRKEAIFLLNEFIPGIETHDGNFTIVNNMLETYTDYANWYLPLNVMVDEQGYEHTLSDIQSNIIQVCLLVEGLGKVASNIGQNFQLFMLKTLYLVLERAGSAHPMIRTAGIKALSDISTGCGYCTITDLISTNIDYFSFHIERKLYKKESTTGALNVLAVVIKYSTREILNSTCEVVRELLLRTYDSGKQNLNAYFHVFKMFISALHELLNLGPVKETFKTKKQKQLDYEDFKVSNLDSSVDFSDDIMGKTPEEMYKEDFNKEELENDSLNEPEGYKKPEPPPYIKLTVSILTRTLHYLPSRDQALKLLILDNLTNGVPILKDWEDELLPIVHQIWSPLVDRFKETDPVNINYSFKLLVVLGKLSKDFIRSRTSKEVLPSILKILDKLVTESYLKDRGSAYRYSQNYKLQVAVLGDLVQVITDLDMGEDDLNKSMEVVFKYLSEKQPMPLQECAIDFFSVLAQYDPETIRKNIKEIFERKHSPEFDKNISELENKLKLNE